MAKQKNQTGDISTPINVLGGSLNVRFHFDGNKFTEIFLEGPATFVFEGEINV
jgi:diaminopimelate epimerase